MPRSETPQPYPDEPGSFIVGEDGVRRPNLNDPAMRERARLTNEARVPATAKDGEEESDVS